MVKRKMDTKEKSRPFTSVILYLPFTISVCGSKEMQEKWNSFFLKNKNLSKSDFIMENFMRDVGTKNKAEIFEDIADSKRNDKKKIEGLMLELGYPNIQEYLNFILDRASEEKSDGVSLGKG